MPALETQCVSYQYASYPVIPNPVRVANDNASALFGICVEKKDGDTEQYENTSKPFPQ